MSSTLPTELSRHMLKRATNLNIPYDSLSSYHFQIGIGSPKWHLFDRQFCVGLPQTICKQWAKGFCKILNFWPLHSVRQNVAGFRRGLFTCFLGHTPLFPAFWATPLYYLLFGPHSLITVIKNQWLHCWLQFECHQWCLTTGEKFNPKTEFELGVVGSWAFIF